MTTEPVAASDAAPAGALTPAQARVVVAARGLFVQHGVGGTSLQMIADVLGVTKAAVYHQFQTKEAIVVASLEFELGTVEETLDAAEAAPDPVQAREILLDKAVDVAVRRRHDATTLQLDPVITRLLAENERYHRLMNRFCNLLVGVETPEGRVRAAMLSSAIAGTMTHPLVADLDDDTLRFHLLYNLTRMLPEVEHAD